MDDFNWSTDWEDFEIDWQDTAIPEMFVRAANERGFFFGEPDPTDINVQDFWLQMVTRCYQLGNSTIFHDDYEGKYFKSWWTALGKTKWPPPNGFRRVYPRTINKITDPGEEGWKARFEVENFVTPADQRILSGRYYIYQSGKWTENEKHERDVLRGFGLPKRGDFLGGHILADCRDCIEMATWYIGPSVNWSTDLKKNARFGAGIARTTFNTDASASAALQESRAKAKSSWAASPLVSWDFSEFQESTQPNFSPAWSATGDPTIRVLAVTKQNRHGTGVIEMTNGDYLHYKAPLSEKFGPPAKPKLYSPDDDPEDYIGTILSDGEDETKRVTVVRIWKPTPQQPKRPPMTSVVINCSFDIPRPNAQFPFSNRDTSPVEVITDWPMAISSDGLAHETFGSGTLVENILAGWVSVLARVNLRPYIQGMNGTTERKLNRQVEFYMIATDNPREFDNHDTNLFAPKFTMLDFNNTPDDESDDIETRPIESYQLHKWEDQPIISDKYEVMGIMFGGSLGDDPDPFPESTIAVRVPPSPPPPVEGEEPPTPPPQPTGASRGFNTIAISLLKFDVPKGFKYQKGYTGK